MKLENLRGNCNGGVHHSWFKILSARAFFLAYFLFCLTKQHEIIDNGSYDSKYSIKNTYGTRFFKIYTSHRGWQPTILLKSLQDASHLINIQV